ncbi:MAG: hypothetical protein JST30_09545 [Armatimonadetes bacterium]|nr:hypothetical protein [Armatimonadota bacterium]
MTLVPLALASITLPVQGEPLLDELAHKAFDYFWEQSHPSTGFTKDRAANFVSSDSYTTASVASTGFALSAYALGSERGWTDRASALARTQATLYALRTVWQKSHGWYYHFVDWRTGQRVWSSEVSSIDTAILLMGALTAERYFQDPAVTSHVDAMLAAVDWSWMLTDGGSKPASQTFCMGWKPESGFLPYRWDTYSELMGLYLLALGHWPSMPANCWTAWTRPQVSYDGYHMLVGGPLFMHQMSHVFFSFQNTRDGLGYDYWGEGRQATLANRKYCINNPKHYAGFSDVFWGLSAGDTPDGYMALGAPGNIVDNGTVVPTSAVASVMFTPLESQAAAAHFKSAYPSAYGKYGFANGINPGRNWRSPDVIGIDLGMMMLGIADFQDHFAHRWFMSHPVPRTGMARVGFKAYKPLGSSGPKSGG